FYDDSIAKMVPSYLQMSLQTLVNEQERFRSQFTPFFAQSPFGSTAFEAMQEQTRKNLAMFEQAMKMWTPFTAALPLSGAQRSDDRSGRAVPAVTPAVAPPATGTPASVVESDFAELKAELAAMQAKIEKLSQTRG
ncbi:MAG: PHB accumulation regulatory domain-containing protein, partial [Hyphomicrobiaceae bacterium]